MNATGDAPATSSNGHGHAGIPAEPPARHPWRRRVVLALLVLTMMAWGWALWYSLARTGPEPLDALSRDQLATACRTAFDDLRALEPLSNDPTVAQRRARILAENEVLDDMVRRAGEVRPEAAEGRTALDGWLGDWRRLLRARSQHAQEILEPGTHRFFLPVDESGKPATKRMDAYALGHGILICSPVTLQAESVDRPREYRLP